MSWKIFLIAVCFIGVGVMLSSFYSYFIKREKGKRKENPVLKENINIINHLDFLIAITGKTKINYKKSQVKTIHFFCLGLIARLNEGAKALRLLINNISEIPNLEFSAALIIRTLISDLLVAIKCYLIQAKGIDNSIPVGDIESELEFYCNCVLADGLRHTIKQLKHLKDADAITDIKLFDTFNNMTINHLRYLEQKAPNAEPQVKFPSPQNSTNLFKEISKDPLLKPLAENFSTFLLYSKYEHYNILSHDLMNRPVSDKLNSISRACWVFGYYNFILHAVLRNSLAEDLFIIEQCNLAGQYIEANIS